MANFAKVHEKTQILNEDWKKLRVQPVQLMKPVSGHPFLKQVWRGEGTAAASVGWNWLRRGLRGAGFCVCCPVSVPGCASHPTGMQKWGGNTPKAFPMQEPQKVITRLHHMCPGGRFPHCPSC